VEKLPPNRNAFVGLIRLRDLVRILAEVGEYDRAIAELEELLKLPGPQIIKGIQILPYYRPLHDHPKFQDLVRKYSQ
jgi:hypothetical protein